MRYDPVYTGTIALDDLKEFSTEHDLPHTLVLEESLGYGCIIFSHTTPKHKVTYTVTLPAYRTGNQIVIYFDYTDACTSDRRRVSSVDKLPVKLKNVLNHLYDEIQQVTEK